MGNCDTMGRVCDVEVCGANVTGDAKMIEVGERLLLLLPFMRARVHRRRCANIVR
jgi:hypothetical protein